VCEESNSFKDPYPGWRPEALPITHIMLCACMNKQTKRLKNESGKSHLFAICACLVVHSDQKGFKGI